MEKVAIDAINTAIKREMDYMSYRMRHNLFDPTGPLKSKADFWAWLDSFEYWAIRNWWNPQWEYLKEKWSSCECDE